jgi:tetratricopeptide (TPR) repeat protein
MKRRLTAVWLALGGGAGALLAQTAPPAPKASAAQAFIIEHLTTRAIWHADGTGSREVSAVIRVQDAAGVQALAILSFPYTSDDQSIAVTYVRVRRPDGTVIPTPADNMRDLPAEVTRTAPMYSDVMEKQVVVTGLDVGDTLEYNYVLNQRTALVPGQFWFSYHFQRQLVCRDERLEVRVPLGRAVDVASPALAPGIAQAGGYRIYTWHTSNPAPAPAPANPFAPAPAAAVQITSFAGWAQVGAWYNRLERSQAVVTPAIRAQAARLTRGLTTDRARIQALYAFVAQRIHYVSLSFGIGRYQPHAADTVLRNGYGDCKDKHTLLEALLRAAGYTAWPALVSLGSAVDTGVASPGQFNHVVTVVERGAKLEWLDATAAVAPAGWLDPMLRGQPALLVSGDAPPRLVTTPAAPPVAAAEDFQIAGALSPQGTLTAKVAFTFTGDSGVLMRAAFSAAPPAQWQTLMQAVMGALGFGGTVNGVAAPALTRIEQPLVVTYDYRREKYSNWRTGQITPPLPAMILPPWNKTLTVLGAAARSVTARSVVTLPPGYVLTPTASMQAADDFATYRSNYSFAHGAYTAERELTVLKRTVPPADEAQYRAFLKIVNADTDVWTTVTAFTGAPSGAPAGARARSDALTTTGWQQVQGGEDDAAARTLGQAVKLNPNNAYAWGDLGLADLDLRRLNAAAAAFQRVIAISPEDRYAYNNLGRVLALQGRLAPAEAAFRKQIAIVPRDPYAHFNLGSLLLREGHAPQAAAELTQAAAIADSGSTEMELGTAEMAAHHPHAAVAALEKAARMEPSPLIENNAAFAIAQAGLDLPRARRLADAADAALEAQLSHISFPGVTLAQLFDVDLLANVWDTVGWVAYRQGNLARAQAYCAAAWNLGQTADVGDHLGRIYQKEGRKADALRLYAEAAGELSTPALARLHALTGSDAAARALVNRHLDDPSNARTYAVPRLLQGHLTTQLYLEFGPGPKLLGVAPTGLGLMPRGLHASLAAVRFRVLFPPGSTAILVRQAVLSCGMDPKHCLLVLMPPDSPPPGR